MPKLNNIRVNPFARPGTEAYVPSTGEVMVHATSTLYAMMHEQAHGIQHRNRTWCWILCKERTPKNKKLGSFVRLLLEIEAVLIARKIMRHVDKWNEKAVQEAYESLHTYTTGRITLWIIDHCIDWTPQPKK